MSRQCNTCQEMRPDTWFRPLRKVARWEPDTCDWCRIEKKKTRQRQYARDRKQRLGPQGETPDGSQ